MFYNVNLFNELLNFYSSKSKFLKDYLNKMLPMLMECSILLIGNTVEMAGG